MIIFMTKGILTIAEIAQVMVVDRMLDYHLHRLELAGLIELNKGQIELTESGKAYGELVKAQKEKGGADML